MKQLLLIILCLFNVSIFAQGNALEFNKNFYECENHWVAFPQSKETNEHIFGFIYVDQTAGYTFDFEGTFTIDSAGKFVAKKKETNGRVLHRLEANTIKMGIIPNDKLIELGLPEEPEWLKHYKHEETAETLVRKGYHLNHIGASQNALEPLLRAYKINPHEPNLEFELSYAYNATGQFQQAVDVLEKALKHNPKDHIFYRELGYSYINLKKPLDAEKVYKTGISVSNDDTQKAEMAYNMAGVYYQSKDKRKFEEWATQVRKFAKPESQFAKNIALMANDVK